MLVASGDKMRFACVANEHVGVFDADKIGWNLRVLLTTVWCI